MSPITRSTPKGAAGGFLLVPFLKSWPVAMLLILHYALVGATLDLFRRAG